MGLINYTNIEDGDEAGANDINQRFGNVLSQVNGNLDSTNIKKGSLTRELFASDSLLAAWPIGSIYITVEDVNPSSVLGGSWVRFASGRTIVGVDGTQSEFKDVEKEGGHKELQAHTHNGRWQNFIPNGTGPLSHNDFGGDGVMITDNAINGINGDWKSGALTASAGSGNAQNLQPYITVYMWKRVA